MDTTCYGGATFGFPAPIYSRDKTRLLTGLFAFFALLRVAIRDDVPAVRPRSSWSSTDSTARRAANRPTMATRPAGLPTTRRWHRCGIAWIEVEHAEADDVIATLVAATTGPC
jgi:DNA polymerase-1